MSHETSFNRTHGAVGEVGVEGRATATLDLGWQQKANTRSILCLLGRRSPRRVSAIQCGWKGKSPRRYISPLYSIGERASRARRRCEYICGGPNPEQTGNRVVVQRCTDKCSAQRQWNSRRGGHRSTQRERRYKCDFGLSECDIGPIRRAKHASIVLTPVQPYGSKRTSTGARLGPSSYGTRIQKTSWGR